MTDDYSEEQLDAIHARVGKWFDAFALSPGFERLSETQQGKAGSITNFFAEYSCTYQALAPEQWTPGSVVECCTEILPRKVSAEPDFFEAVAPVLSAFFSYLGDESLLPKGRTLAKAAADAHEDLVGAASDRRNWGPAKRFVMAAQEAGVDIQDADALKAFTIQSNLQQVGRSRASTTAPPFWPAAQAPQPPKQNFKPPENRYDPCPCGSGKKYKFCCASNN